MKDRVEGMTADELFESRYQKECHWVHRFMVWIMVGQFFLGLAFAIFLSPFTWIGQQYEIHIHVWAALIIGGSLSSFAILWMKFFPDAAHTRHVVAISQTLWSALLIHLSGGRIETHFHVFASLAILSIYRDWKILITATVVVAMDHFGRGVYYPASVFGVVTESPYRWIEHAAWVVFEVAFLAPGCYRLRNEVRELCVRQYEIEEAKRSVDLQVQERTSELSAAYTQLEEQTAVAQKLAMVAKYTDNAVVITDGDSRIEWVNEGYTRISGYSLDEVVGRCPSDFQHGPATDPETKAFMRNAVREKRGFNTEVVNYRKDGDAFWLAMEVRPIADDMGNVNRFIAIQSDITERKNMELSLADAEARLRSIINNVPGAFYRREVSDECRTVFVSEWIYNLTGHNPEEFTAPDGLNLLDFVHPDDLTELNAAIQSAIDEESEFEREYRIIDANGNVKWIREKGQCLKIGEGTCQIFVDGMLFDVTQKVLAERENQRLQQDLLDVSRQAGMAEIATGVLHNVGNILNSVNVSASVIRKQYSRSALANLEKVSDLIAEHESSFDEFIREDTRGRKIPAYIRKVTEALCNERNKVSDEFDDLLRNVEHIKEIVSVQQSMAKSSGLQQELDAQDLIHDALAANKASLMSHRIEVEQSINKALPVFVSDKHRILQILINLIKNAKDALVENQTPDARIEITATTEENRVVFRVADNGIGIATEKLERIFQHGFTTKKSGHGFGLHSSANAATEMGGSLTVCSNGIGTGATFVLRLPLQLTNHEKNALELTT
ncbi:PAS domain S-box protein [Thalassoroseus pseudoceratinae]|uniref:PAS domain S-box protein n=1 Tax=Thalassoroseus pseudoceratinae TaxID=2713176 RepID=UPI0014217287|nr:PAS domain S-box protein [Thalassoroseus pseudoceratinae]